MFRDNEAKLIQEYEELRRRAHELNVQANTVDQRLVELSACFRSDMSFPAIGPNAKVRTDQRLEVWLLMTMRSTQGTTVSAPAAVCLGFLPQPSATGRRQAPYLGIAG